MDKGAGADHGTPKKRAARGAANERAESGRAKPPVPRKRSAPTRTRPTQPPNELEPIPPSEPYSRPRRIYNDLRTRWWRYRVGRDLEYFRQRDPKEQLQLALPEGEVGLYHCLWLTEFYTPAETDEALRRLARMSKGSTPRYRENLAEWMHDAREKPYSGAWLNVGYFIQRGSKRAFFGPETYETELPRGVTHAPAALVSLTPSLTALVMQFIFDDSVTAEWLAPLSAHHVTYARRAGRVTQFVGPVRQTQEEITARRLAIRARSQTWFGANLPGYFSRVGELMPAIEVVSFKGATPLLGRGRLDDYLYALGLYEDVGDCVFDEELRLRLPQRSTTDAAIIAAREDELYRWVTRHETGHGWTRTAIEVRLSDLSQFAAVLALDGLIASFERSLAQTRDRGIRPGGLRPSEALRTVEGQLAGVSRGVQAFAPELEEVLDRPWFGRDLPDLRYIAEFLKDESPGKTLIESYKRRVRNLAASEKVARELLVASAQIAAVRENLRLQGFGRLLAVAALVVSAASFLNAVGGNADKLIAGWKELLRMLFG